MTVHSRASKMNALCDSTNVDSHCAQRYSSYHTKSAKRESQPHNSFPTLHQPINVVRYRHPMGSVALPDCSAEAVSKQSQDHAQQVASYLCEWVATTGFEPGTDGWVVANSRSAKKD
jgi:hypothetical protein